MAVRYRNLETGSVAVFSQPNRRLAGNDRWELVVDTDEVPAMSASKAEWVDYAESVGIDTDGMTKDEVIAAVGA